MAEQYERAGEMEHAGEILQVILVTRDQPTIILEPCEQALDLPSTTIATQGAAIRRQVRAVRAVRSSPHRFQPVLDQAGQNRRHCRQSSDGPVLPQRSLPGFASRASLRVAWRFLCKP